MTANRKPNINKPDTKVEKNKLSLWILCVVSLVIVFLDVKYIINHSDDFPSFVTPFIFVAVNILVIGLLLWYFLPKMVIRSVSQADVHDEYSIRDSLAKLLGGISVLLGLLWTVFDGASSQNLKRFDQEGQNYFQIATLLGSDKEETRSAAIYALPTFLGSHSELKSPLRNNLENFVVNRVRNDVVKHLKDNESLDWAIGLDIQAAIDVLGEKKINLQNSGYLKFSHLDLRGAIFRSEVDGKSYKNIQFFESNLRRAKFQGADLEGAYFSGADMMATLAINDPNIADVGRSDHGRLYDAPTRLSDANLKGAYFSGLRAYAADFNGADLTDAHFDDDAIVRLGTFLGSSLSGADFSCADLRGAKFDNAIFDKNTTFKDANLSGVSFKQSKGLTMDAVKAGCICGNSQIVNVDGRFLNGMPACESYRCGDGNNNGTCHHSS